MMGDQALLSNISTTHSLTDKIHAAFWVGSMVLVVTKSDLIRVCLSSDEVHRLSFNLGVIFLVSCFLERFVASHT